MKSIAEQEWQRQGLLTQMANFIKKLQQYVGTDEEFAVQCLQCAIKAVGNLARTMAVGKRYWEGMGDLCQNLSESYEGLIEDDTFMKNAKERLSKVRRNIFLQVRECHSPEEAKVLWSNLKISLPLNHMAKFRIKTIDCGIHVCIGSKTLKLRHAA